MATEKKYTIGKVVYIQRPVVLAQLTQLIEIIPDDADITGIKGPNDVIAFLGEALAAGMAIVLCPEGVDLQKKDLDVIKANLMNAMDIPTAVEVIEDFFGCNQVSSLVERVGSLMDMMENPGSASGSKSGSASLPTETSPGET